MDLIRTFRSNRPIAVISAVLMVRDVRRWSRWTTIPIQLTPDVRRPVLTVTTNWPSAAPIEVEREITNRQEEVLKGLEGVTEMTSRSEDGRAQVTLEFDVATNMDRALLLLANRLDRVSGYPAEADEPVIATSGTEDNPIAWFIIKREAGNETPIHTYRDFIDDVVRDRIERVPGVSGSNLYGGGEREMRVVVDPERMAQYGLTVPGVVETLRAANAAISGGEVEEGKRRYATRIEGDFQTPEQVKAASLRAFTDPVSGRVGRVTVGEIADVEFGYKDATAHIRNLGDAALAVNATMETGANVIEVMAGLREAVSELASVQLPAEKLTIKQVYDETVYIDSSIQLVQQNIVVGGALAAFILILFLRSLRATLVVSLAIPVSVIGSFVAMAALGRSLNVISLAGIAFAVGMVVDAAIVVLENIYRLREQGMSPREAAYERRPRGLGRDPGLGPDDGHGLHPDPGDAAGGRPAVPRHRGRHLRVGAAVAGRLGDGDTGAVATCCCQAKDAQPYQHHPACRLSTGWRTGLRRAGDELCTPSGGQEPRPGAAVPSASFAVSPRSGRGSTCRSSTTCPTGNRNLIFGIILPPPGYNLAIPPPIDRPNGSRTKCARPVGVG